MIKLFNVYTKDNFELNGLLVILKHILFSAKNVKSNHKIMSIKIHIFQFII